MRLLVNFLRYICSLRYASCLSFVIECNIFFIINGSGQLLADLWACAVQFGAHSHSNMVHFYTFASKGGYMLQRVLTGTNDNVIHRQHFSCFILNIMQAFYQFCVLQLVDKLYIFLFQGSTMDRPVVLPKFTTKFTPYCLEIISLWCGGTSALQLRSILAFIVFIYSPFF